MDPTIRLRIATRIHFALLRHYDENIAVDTLLKGAGEAREALWVCEASGHDDLVLLAKRFAAATRAERRAAQEAAVIATAPKAPPAAAPQEMAWSRDTSGFAVTRPPEAHPDVFAKAPGWFTPSRWLRQIAPR